VAQENDREVTSGKEKEAVPAEITGHDGNNQATRTTEMRLREPVVVEYLDISLQEALSHLSEVTDSQFYVKWHRLEDFGLARDSTINLFLEAPANTVLEFVLDQVDSELQYSIRDGIVVVSTTDDLLFSTMSIRIYDCSDLIQTRAAVRSGMMGGMGENMENAAEGFGIMASSLVGGMGEFGMDESTIPAVASNNSSLHLIQIVQNIVDPESWSRYGGPGTIAEMNGMVIINQNDRTHSRVDSLLNMMRKARNSQQRRPSRR
jgi:hypothetical protein